MLHSTPIQAARAAMIIWQCLQYRRLIERQELEPVLKRIKQYCFKHFVLYLCVNLFFYSIKYIM